MDRQKRERPKPGFSPLVPGSVRLDHELADRDTIDAVGTGEYEVRVYHTPGRSLVQYHCWYLRKGPFSVAMPCNKYCR